LVLGPYPTSAGAHDSSVEALLTQSVQSLRMRATGKVGALKTAH
jgi:hypothetical protein